jgi:hypothetical protein
MKAYIGSNYENRLFFQKFEFISAERMYRVIQKIMYGNPELFHLEEIACMDCAFLEITEGLYNGREYELIWDKEFGPMIQCDDEEVLKEMAKFFENV